MPEEDSVNGWHTIGRQRVVAKVAPPRTIGARIRDAWRVLIGQKTEEEAQLRAEHERMCDRVAILAREFAHLRNCAEGARKVAQREDSQD